MIPATSKNRLPQPKWLDKNEYPFISRFFQLKEGKMHYVDEGSGPVILFVHGTPVWSFVYRKMIKELSKNYRCIAIDHLGFGLSDKPENYDYHPRNLSHNLEKFVQHLGLRNITLVVHDFGGPIGLGYAINNPENIERIVMMNTWLWETKSNPEAQKIDKILHGFLGKFLYLRFNFSAKMLIPQAFSDKKKLTKSTHKQYINPFPQKSERFGPLGIGQNLVGASDWYASLWKKIDRLAQKPWQVLWGMEDKFIGPEYLKKWRGALQNATFKELPAGHFVQEEASEEVVNSIRDFIPH